MVVHAEQTTVSHVLVTCHVSRSPAEAEQDPGPERLVVEPGRVLVDLHVCAQQQRHPLREARSTRAIDRPVSAVMGY